MTSHSSLHGPAAASGSRFGRFELRVDERLLLFDGEQVKLGARAFDVLCVLAERRERVVTKIELLELAWPNLVVEENNIEVQISALRKLLGAQAIATIPGRGYRFALATAEDDGGVASNASTMTREGAASRDEIRSNLPVQLTSFIGREAELDGIRAQLQQARLLTLTGVGGSGKTRLSIQAAASVVASFPDGTWFVDLAPIADPTLLSNAVASALRVTVGAGRSPEDALQDFLRTKQLLLVIDNCEHLVVACAQLTHRLLVQCPQVKILATSREALGVPGEVASAVQPLAIPGPESFGLHPASLQSLSEFESVRLFVDRARSVRPDFTITTSSARFVAEICFRLDGIPLAIELAAARAKVLSPLQILSRLDDRFALLTGGSRTALPRQQTLRAAVDWSYDLLTEPERVLLRRLSVFAGGCTLAAAEAVGSGPDMDSGAVLDLLSRLVDKSLVVARDGPSETRYHLLETVRQYGDARLREANETDTHRDAHLDHFLQFAKAAEPRLRDTGQVEWLGRLQAETDNLRAAMEWACRAGKTCSGLALARWLGRYWHIRSEYSEGRYWLQRMQQLPDAAAHPDNFAWVLYFEGVMATFQLDTGTIRHCLTRSLEVAMGCANRHCTAYALDFLGVCALMDADFELADARLDEAQSIFLELGDRWGTAFNMWHSGQERDARNDQVGALALWEQSLALFQQLGDQNRASILLGAMGRRLVQNGEIQRGTDLLRQALRISSERAAILEIGVTLWGFAVAVQEDGNPRSGQELMHAAVAVLDSIGSIRSVASNLMEVATARAWFARNQAQYERAIADRRIPSMNRAIELALGYEFGPDPVSHQDSR